MNKGVVIFLTLIVLAVLFCWYLPFSLLPSLDRAFALPVITVPGEKLCTDCWGINGLTLTNTIVGTLLADFFVLLFALGATWKLRQVPGRLQSIFEMLTDALYGLAKSTAGPLAKTVFPVMATIFLFLLVANWLELVPGVDSVGIMHCAEDGFSGYPADGAFLKVSKALDAGERATEADYEACHAKEAGEEAHDDEAVIPAEGEAAVPPAEGEAPAEDAAETPAAGPVDEAEAAEGEVNDDIHIVTPFIRAAATDLNLTLGLALLAVIIVQVIGVRTLGASYFAKFINIPALDKADRNPMGIMDFAVGFLEIISEVSRIISFGFRLFGNIFAGQVLLFVIPFLAGALLPLFVYGFEMFVGVIQAFVFAMLFLVFAASAATGHEHAEPGEHE